MKYVCFKTGIVVDALFDDEDVHVTSPPNFNRHTMRLSDFLLSFRSQGWIGVDLDGTLAYYDHWRGPEHIGDPIAPMVARVFGWLHKGIEVKIFTARVGPHDPATVGVEYPFIVRSIIEDWCEKHLGRRLDVTATKDFNMIELWDDRAIQVVTNTGMTINQRLHL